MTDRLAPAPPPPRAPRAAVACALGGLLALQPAAARAQATPATAPPASSPPATAPPVAAAPFAPGPAGSNAPAPATPGPAPGASASAPPAAAPSAVSPAGATQGVVVVAAGDAADAAWPLATAVYGDALLRPRALHDDAARVLAGEAPPAGAPANVRELAELRAAVRGDDAPSRSVLATLAQRTGAAALLVVFAPAAPGGPVTARPFDPRTGRFEAFSLEPDPSAAPASRWSAATAELRRRYGAPPPRAAAAAPARPKAAPAARPAEAPRRWWASPWLWAATGLAVLAGVVVVASTRNNQNDDAAPTSARVDVRVDR